MLGGPAFPSQHKPNSAPRLPLWPVGVGRGGGGGMSFGELITSTQVEQKHRKWGGGGGGNGAPQGVLAVEAPRQKGRSEGKLLMLGSEFIGAHM